MKMFYLAMPNYVSYKHYLHFSGLIWSGNLYLLSKEKNMRLELIPCLKQLPSHSKINKLTPSLILFSWTQVEHRNLKGNVRVYGK